MALWRGETPNGDDGRAGSTVRAPLNPPEDHGWLRRGEAELRDDASGPERLTTKVRRVRRPHVGKARGPRKPADD